MVQNTELYIVQSDNMFNYEPTLLDENTVNQFLLPLPESSENNQTSESTGPDLLALHSCVICHEIFTTEADLLDHTISLHTSDNSVEQLENTLLTTTDHDRIETKNVQEQLCCISSDGKGNVASRKLYTMYVCDFCSGLFADGDALDKHRLTCFIEDQNHYYEDQNDNCNLDTTAHGPIVCYACDICGKQYGSTEDLKAHSLECHKPRASRRSYTNSGNTKMWNCGSCNQLFATARELYRHKRGEDRPPGAPLMAYVCEECDKVLGSMCALHTHKKMHKVTKPGYPCRVCGRRFNQSGHLAIHMRMHTGERPYPCDLCPKAFKVKFRLTVNYAAAVPTHWNHQLARQDKTFRRLNLLTTSGLGGEWCSDIYRTTITTAPITCKILHRASEVNALNSTIEKSRQQQSGSSPPGTNTSPAFRRPYARTVHTLIHTGEKPHECDICGTAFSPLSVFLPDPYIRNPYPQEAGNALVTPMVFRVSMGGADCLPSGNTLIQCSRKVTYENVANVSLKHLQQSKDGCDKESTCHHNYCWRSQHSAQLARATLSRTCERHAAAPPCDATTAASARRRSERAVPTTQTITVKEY
ncbi:unnamed protein product [Spodoptera exigua]|nr:unnamed protein product [Spodoptera exigua]